MEKIIYNKEIKCCHCNALNKFDLLKFICKSCNHYVICPECSYANLVNDLPKNIGEFVCSQNKDHIIICQFCLYSEHSSVDNIKLRWFKNMKINDYRYLYKCKKCNTTLKAKLEDNFGKEIQNTKNSCIDLTTCCKEEFYMSETKFYKNKWYEFGKSRYYFCSRCNQNTYIPYEDIPNIVLKRLLYDDFNNNDFNDNDLDYYNEKNEDDENEYNNEYIFIN